MSYQKAIAVKPDYADAHLNLGNAFKEKGEVKEAIVSYQKAIEVKPDFADAYLNLGNVLKEEGEVEEAIASYRRAIEVNPDFADAYLNWGWLLIRQVRIIEAAKLLRKGEARCDDSPEIKYLLGILLLSQGECEEGNYLLQKAFKIDPNYRKKVDGFSLRSDTPEAFWKSLHSTEESHLGYWKKNPRRSKLASVICSLGDVNDVLECGCNVGGNLAAIHALNDQIKLKGIDMNHAPIEFGVKKFAELGVRVDMSVKRLQDLVDVEGKSVDVVYTSAVLQHIPPEFIPDILRNMIRISKKYVVLYELHGFSPADAFVHRLFIEAVPALDGRWIHDYWSILSSLGVDRSLITAQQLDPKICLGKSNDFNCIFSFPV